MNTCCEAVYCKFKLFLLPQIIPLNPNIHPGFDWIMTLHSHICIYLYIHLYYLLVKKFDFFCEMNTGWCETRKLCWESIGLKLKLKQKKKSNNTFHKKVKGQIHCFDRSQPHLLRTQVVMGAALF